MGVMFQVGVFWVVTSCSFVALDRVQWGAPASTFGSATGVELLDQLSDCPLLKKLL